MQLAPGREKKEERNSGRILGREKNETAIAQTLHFFMWTMARPIREAERRQEMF